MTFFNFWKRNRPAAGTPAPQADIPKDLFLEDAPKPGPVDANIEMLNRFLARNHETKGFEDALINPDITNLDENVEAIRNEFRRTLRTVRQFYADFIREIDFHIDSRTRRGMVDMVEELRMKKEIAQTHIVRIDEIHADAQNGTGEYQGIIITYTRGFKNGLAAISHHNILSKKF